MVEVEEIADETQKSETPEAKKSTSTDSADTVAVSPKTKPAAEVEAKEAKAPATPEQPEIKPTMFVAPAAMMALRYFKIDLTVYVNELRVAFGVFILLKLLVLAYTYFKSQANADATPVEVVEKGMDGVTKRTVMTAKEYDAAEIKKAFSSSLFGLAITCGVHYKWGNPTPLLFQCVMGPMGFFDDKEFLIHVLGKKAEGKLARPFKAPPNPLAELMGAPAAAEPAAEAPPRGKKDKKND